MSRTWLAAAPWVIFLLGVAAVALGLRRARRTDAAADGGPRRVPARTDSPEELGRFDA